MNLAIENFQKEKGKFFIFYEMLATGESRFLTDNESYIIGQGSIGYPAWIWTKDNIEPAKIEEVKKVLRENYLTNPVNSITCKKEMYEALKTAFTTSDYFEVGFLQCEKLNPMTLSEGYLDGVDYGDKITLAEYWKENIQESFPEQMTTDTAILEEVDYWLENENFFVWRDVNRKILSMANYTKKENLVKISHVYTPKDERGKGYCESLMHNITERILNKGWIPLLYTENDNLAAIHIYEKIGYHKEEYLVSFKIEVPNNEQPTTNVQNNV